MRVPTAIQEPITAILVDDESGSLRDLERKLRSFPELTILAAVTRQSLAISLIRQLQPDVIFLDIAMPHMNGFQLLAELGDYHSKVVFTAPYDHYSIEALRMNAFDYLVKPVDTAALRETVARLTRLIRG